MFVDNCLFFVTFYLLKLSLNWMLLVQAKLQVGVNMTMTFLLHVEDKQVIRKSNFEIWLKCQNEKGLKHPGGKCLPVIS